MPLVIGPERDFEVGGYYSPSMWAPTVADPQVTTTLAWLAQTRLPERVMAHGGPETLLFIDFETTRDRVIEVALIRLQRGMSPWVWQSYIDPGPAAWNRSREYWNTDIHGVTPMMVRGQPTFVQILPTMGAALKDAVVVAHNVEFERKFLELELRILGRQLASPTLCTLKLARALRPDLSHHKLTTLASIFEIRNPTPHRALGDAFTTVWAMMSLLEQYKGTRPVAAHLRDCTRTASGGRPSPWE